MQPTQKTPTTTPQPKVSHKASITGFVLALASLALSGIANFSIYAKYSPTGPTTGSVDREVGHAVATGTTTVLGTLFGMMFLVGALVLGFLALVFIVVRLRKVRAGGAVFSIISIVLAVWSMSIAIGLFNVIKA